MIFEGLGILKEGVGKLGLLLLAFADVLHRAEMFESHHIEREKLSTRERMSLILDRLRSNQFVPFAKFFHFEEGKLGVVVTFLALLELMKEALVDIIQNEAMGPIHVQARTR